jgi:ubiquinone/menaquinone biosynthesis C-methylase UbiE
MIGDLKMTDAYEWVTKNYCLRKKRDLEEMQKDLKKATSANAYSWIKKGNMTMELTKGSENILDVGCGWGRELCKLQNAVGVDISQAFLRTARNYVKNDVILTDAYYLPFKNNSFSFVVMSEVIEHLTNPTKVLVEIKRVLKTNGRLLIQTPNKVLTLGKFISTEKCGHIHEFTFVELKNLLEPLGFSILERTGSTIPYIPSTSRLEKLDHSRLFFSFWRLLNKIIPLKWDIIILSESANSK